MNWFGVMPAITTPFDRKLAVDHAFLTRHATWLLDNGCTGLVMLGSLGEGATLEHAEKIAILETAVQASAKKKTPVVAAISALSTAHAVELAREAEQAGCDGLMVLPPYVYSSDWREMKQHVATVIAATKLPCMLYNNPVAYKTDFLPVQIKELAAEHENLQAVKESSADVRRVAGFARCSAIASLSLSASTTCSSKASTPERKAGSRAWSTPSRPSPSSSSTWLAQAVTSRPLSSTAGSFHSCAWTPYRNSFN